MRSARYRPLFKQFFWLFVIACVGLGWLGTKPPEGIYVILARIFTTYYFAFFLIVLPLLGIFEKTKPVRNQFGIGVGREDLSGSAFLHGVRNCTQSRKNLIRHVIVKG